MKRIILKTENATYKFSQKFAKTLKGGEVISLVGELGSGKTTFVKGLAKALGVKDNVTSPTFIRLIAYEIPSNKKIKKLVHIDAYRIIDVDEMIDAGIEDYLNEKDTVTIVEWGDKLKRILPKDTIWITFKLKVKTNERVIEIKD